jgi:tetratricopeptide (TPR) repeat protein
MNWRRYISAALIPVELFMNLAFIRPDSKKIEQQNLDKLKGMFSSAYTRLTNVHPISLGELHGMVTDDKMIWHPVDNVMLGESPNLRFLDEAKVEFVKRCAELKMNSPGMSYENIFREARKGLGDFEVTEQKVNYLEHNPGDAIWKHKSDDHIDIKQEVPGSLMRFSSFSGRGFSKDNPASFDKRYIPRDLMLITDFDKLLEAYEKARQLGPETLEKSWTENGVTEYEIENGTQDKGVVGNMLYDLEGKLENLDKLLKLMPSNQISKEDAASVIASAWDFAPRMPAQTMQISPVSQQSNVARIYAEQLALGTLSVLRDLYAASVDEVVVADRGNRPAGMVLEHIVGRLDIDMKINFAKISQIKKVSESYSFTDEFAASTGLDVAEVNGIVEKVRGLRKEYNEKGIMHEDAQELKAEIARIEEGLSSLYAETRARARELYSAGLQRYTDLSGRFVIFDDFIRTGKTRDDTIGILRDMGHDAGYDNFIAAINTTENVSNVAAINPVFSSVYDWKQKCSWKELLEYHNRQLEIGINYGMDKDVKDAEKMFDRWQVKDHYKLPKPKDGLAYEENEAKWLGWKMKIEGKYRVSADFHFEDRIKAMLTGKSWSKELEEDINMVVTETYQTILLLEVNRMMSRFGKDELLDFVIGKRSPNVEDAVNSMMQQNESGNIIGLGRHLYDKLYLPRDHAFLESSGALPKSKEVENIAA